ncbi:MAG: hypothetical protein RLY30_737 [Pseudomonadota bacterium]|jgi:hypothetical protein
MNQPHTSAHDSQLKAALQSLQHPEPSHGFDARMSDLLSSLPQSAHPAEALGELALAGQAGPSRAWSVRGSLGARPVLLSAGLVFALVLAVSTAAWMQSSPPMPSNLLEPDTLSVLSYGLL